LGYTTEKNLSYTGTPLVKILQKVLGIYCFDLHCG